MTSRPADWHIAVRREACFGGLFWELRLFLDEDEATASLGSTAERCERVCPEHVDTKSVAPELVEAFLAQLQTVLAREEPWVTDRSTTRTYAEVRARHPPRRWTFETSGLPPAALFEVAEGTEDAELARQVELPRFRG